jgi:hypothetical protein
MVAAVTAAADVATNAVRPVSRSVHDLLLILFHMLKTSVFNLEACSLLFSCSSMISCSETISETMEASACSSRFALAIAGHHPPSAIEIALLQGREID